ncbi:MAG: FUSC family protein [Actinobacteria bacterium]|nr:FUSC family protein [Actinomycetota bacterium]
MQVPWRSAYIRLATLTALASVAAYVIAELLPFADPIPAAITAAVATRATFHHAAKETVFQTLGALLGAAIALAIVSVIGTGPIVIFLLVLLCFALARVLRLASPEESPFVAASMAVTVILVVGTHFTTELAVERFVGVAVGALCALAASAFATPTRDTRLLRRDIDALQDDLSGLLAEMARGLRDAPDRETARDWREQAVALRNRSIGLDARLEDLAVHARWSPRIDPDDLAGLGQSLGANRVMSSRVLSIASDLAAASGGRSGARIPQAALSPLADLMAMAADNISADDPSTSVGRTQAHEAVRVADQTAQIALIGGIVSNINRINEASTEPDDDTGEIDHWAT